MTQGSQLLLPFPVDPLQVPSFIIVLNITLQDEQLNVIVVRDLSFWKKSNSHIWVFGPLLRFREFCNCRYLQLGSLRDLKRLVDTTLPISFLQNQTKCQPKLLYPSELRISPLKTRFESNAKLFKVRMNDLVLCMTVLFGSPGGLLRGPTMGNVSAPLWATSVSHFGQHQSPTLGHHLHLLITLYYDLRIIPVLWKTSWGVCQSSWTELRLLKRR